MATKPNNLYGRTVIYTSAEEIDSNNVADILETALSTHQANVTQIDYLYQYYKGETDILERTKDIRDDILNQINENRAKEIVDFKTSYLVGSPVVYSTPTDEHSDAVNMLNQFMRIEGKSTKDYSLVEWQMIAGTSYRAVLPKDEYEDGDCPLTIDTVDPRQAFVIYSGDIHKNPKACVYMVQDSEGITWYWLYTADKCFKLNDDNDDIETSDWTLGYLPIIEYPANNARLGAFEVVIDLLNAINNLDSNRMDGIEQFIQALLVLVNCKLPDGYTATTVAQNGLIELVSNADNPAKVEILTQQLDQQQTQTLKEDLYNAVLTICAMPNRNGGSSTSDTGIAVIYRDGWSSAESARRTSQQMFVQSEYNALRLILRIMSETGTLEIPLVNLNIDFTQDHYENLATKTEVLIALLNNDKVHPLTAYEVCGMFADPNARFKSGMEWYNSVNGNNAIANTVAEDETEVTVTDEADRADITELSTAI